jgi:delta 1-pyrroline-5-carboxylate dehydrogenase
MIVLPLNRQSKIDVSCREFLCKNDKTTGAVVRWHPFRGDRKSGTNDKAGSALNLLP